MTPVWLKLPFDVTTVAVVVSRGGLSATQWRRPALSPVLTGARAHRGMDGRLNRRAERDSACIAVSML